MVYTWTHGIDKESRYTHGLTVLTTPMLLTWTHVIVSVLLNHTNTRGLKVARMRDIFPLMSISVLKTKIFILS